MQFDDVHELIVEEECNAHDDNEDAGEMSENEES